MLNTKQYESRVTPTWCPGCGNFGIIEALKQALVKLNLKPNQVSIFYDIGCNSNMAGFLQTNGFNGLHGRALVAGCGAALSHHQYPIFVMAGDGAAYGEGLNHFIEACRANYKIVYLVSNNQLYSLTTGQTSPTTPKGQITKSAPFGNLDEPLNPLTTALVNHASFVARGFSGNVAHLKDLIIKAYEHDGFGFIDILSPCVTWNKAQPWKWYQERVYSLKNENYSFEEAMKLAQEAPNKLPYGVLFQNKRPSYQSQIPALKNKPLVKQEIDRINITSLIEEFI